MAFYSYLSTKIIIAFITKSYQDLFGVRSYINAKQVADYLGISMDAVRKRCQRGQLPFHRSASRLYFSRMEIDDTILDRELLTKFA